MRKLFIFIMMVILTVLIVPKATYADMFAKPTAVIEVKGIDQPYRFELLIPYGGTAQTLQFDEYAYRLEQYYNDDYPIDILNGYQDSDGFAARTLYGGGAPTHLSLEGANIFKVGYYSAPRTFKILIILDDQTMISSKVIERKMFTSEMIYDLTGVNLGITQTNVGDVIEQIPVVDFTWKYVVRVITTIIVELLVLFAFMYTSKKSFILVGLVNFFTQSALTAAMVVAYYFWAAEIGLIVTLVLGEIIVFSIEMVIYAIKLDEKTRKRAILYGFIANLATLLLAIFTLGFI